MAKEYKAVIGNGSPCEDSLNLALRCILEVSQRASAKRNRVIPGKGPLFFSPYLLLLVKFLAPRFCSFERHDLGMDIGTLKENIVNIGQIFST